MSSLTSRIKLTKPAGTDPVDIAVLDADFDISDTEIGVPVVPVSSPLPTVPYDGQTRYDKNDGYHKIYDAALTLWRRFSPNHSVLTQGAGGAWKSVNPTILNVTLGTTGAFNILDYIVMPGNLVFWKWKMILGTGGSVTGTAGFTLPADVPCDASNNASYLAEDPIGWGRCGLVSGASQRHSLTACLLTNAAPGNLFFVINDTGNPVNGTGTNPFAWAAGGAIFASGVYRTSA